VTTRWRKSALNHRSEQDSASASLNHQAINKLQQLRTNAAGDVGENETIRGNDFRNMTGTHIAPGSQFARARSFFVFGIPGLNQRSSLWTELPASQAGTSGDQRNWPANDEVLSKWRAVVRWSRPVKALQ
jgi:hypothetical protein